MTDQMEKAVALASKISAKTESMLDNIEREMTIRDWPADFRAIMWEAIAGAATSRAKQVKRT